LINAKNPDENIAVKPNDVISVPRAPTVYVIGEVQKAGGYVLNDREDVTVLQALSMAGGVDKMAKPQDARILRLTSGSVARMEIPVNVTKILEGKNPDVRMQGDDILFVPNNVSKRAAVRAIEAMIQTGSGILIWSHP
jgi:polysaccharide biosynthesis/export protein